MADQVPRDATMRAVVASLREPVEYLRRVVGNMVLCKREHGGAAVRIGTTGTGAYPHYRVEPLTDMLEALDGTDAPPWSAYFVAYHGRSHNRLEWGQSELKAAHWSSQRMTLDEVQALLGELRRPANA